MKTNTLVEIPKADWQKLADLYSNHKTTPSGWNCLRNYINWLQVDKELEFLKIYSLNGDWSDGTFIIQDDISIMFNTRDSNHDRLQLALDCIQFLEQFKNVTYICLCDFSHRFKKLINKYMEPTGIQIDTKASWLHIERDKAVNFHLDVPPKTHLQPLNKSHIGTVNSLWAYQYSGSEDFIGRLIRFNVSVGLFDESGSLMGWCLQLPRGSLGLLQVRDEYKRRGYGSLIVRAMAKRLTVMGTEVTAAVVESNEASRKMFEKIGFKEIDTIHWVCRPMKASEDVGCEI